MTTKTAATPLTDEVFESVWRDVMREGAIAGERLYRRQAEAVGDHARRMERDRAELREALERCYAHFCKIRPEHMEPSPMMEQARAALAKAKE